MPLEIHRLEHRDRRAVTGEREASQVPETSSSPSTLRGAADAVDRALASVRPLVTMWRDGLTVIALESAQPSRTRNYLTFDEAQADHAVEVREAAVQAVPTVDAVTGPVSVLVLGGDTIIGGAQNRIINITILLKAAATTPIPVSCLELGRWNDGRQFASARPVDHAMRGMVADQVSRGLRGARPGADRFGAVQGAIWQEIGERQGRAAFRSPTQAIHDVYEREQSTVDDFVGAFPVPPGSRGIAIGLLDRLVGLDIFDSAETAERQWSRLVASAASALLDRQRAIAMRAAAKPRHRHVDPGALDRMLGRARAALGSATVSPSVGLGRDVRFAAPRLVGTALVHDRRAVHVALFRHDAP